MFYHSFRIIIIIIKMLDILRVLVKRHNLNDVGIPPISQFTQKKIHFLPPQFAIIQWWGLENFPIESCCLLWATLEYISFIFVFFCFEVIAVSLRVSRLILMDPEGNNQVGLQWSSILETSGLEHEIIGEANFLVSSFYHWTTYLLYD